MTGNDTLREQTRAVFLAALVVLSVFGGTMAFAGTAAATATGLQVQTSQPVTPGETVTLEVTADTKNDIDIGIDANNDDTIQTAEQVAFVPAGDLSGSDGSFSTTVEITPSDADGLSASAADTYTVAAKQESNGDDSDDSDEKFGTGTEVQTDLEVDGSAPTVVSTTPEDGATVSTATPEVTVTIDETGSSIDESTVEVSASNGDSQLFELNATEADGITYTGGVLTVDFAATKLDALPEDETITMSVTAQDQAGNVLTNGAASTSFDFTVDTNPVDVELTQVPSDTVTKPSEETISAAVTNSSANLEQATVTVSLANSGFSESFDMTSDVYSYSAETGVSTFTVDIGDDGDIADLPEGEILVEAMAVDTDGKGDSESTTFVVDTQGPGVESISVNDGDVVNNSNAGAVPVTVTFNESVDATSVDGSIYVDDDKQSDATLTAGSQGADASTVTFETDLSETSVDNGSAEVRFGTADDVHANTNDSLDTTQTFSIDTQGPSVSVDSNELPADSVLQNVVDLSEAFSASDTEGNEYVLFIKPGEDGDFVPLSDVSDEPLSDFDTTTLPEGTHALKINVTDDAGNSASQELSVTVDNEAPSVEYVGPDRVTGEVDVSALFDVSNNGTEMAAFGYADGDTDLPAGEIKDADATFTADSGTYTVGVTVADPGSEAVTVTETVDTLSADDYTVSTETHDDAGTVNVTISSADELSAFNVSVDSSDAFHQTASSTVSDAAFTVNESATESGDYEYTYVYDAPRDGRYSIALENLTLADQGQTLTGGVATASAVADTGAPTLEDADVVDADQNGMTVRLEFSEPVDSIESFGDFNGASVTQEATPTPEDGVVNVTVSDEVQTAGDTELNAVGVTEAYDAVLENDEDAPEDTADAAADVDTIELDLSEGLNVVSIPAETGAVSLESLDLADKGIVSVMTYDGGNWATYVPGEGGSIDVMTGGDGYIIRASADTELDVDAENVPKTQDSALTSEQLENGWNLIGAYQEGSQSVSQAFAPLPDSADWSVEKGYTGTTVNTLAAGEGYWLFTNDESAVHVRVPYTGLSSEKPSVTDVTVTEDSGDDTVTTDDTVQVRAYVQDDSTLSSVAVDASALGGSESLTLTDENDDGYYDTTFDVGEPSASDGSVSLPVTAVDPYGNVGTGADSVTLDTSSPTYDSASKAGDKSTISVTLSDTGSGLDASTIEQSDFNLPGAGSIDGFDKSGVSDGDNTATVTLTVSGINSDPADVDIDGTISDVAGNTLTTGTQQVTGMDSVSPSITGATKPADATYSTGQTLTFTVSYDEAVTVDTTGGTPSIDLTVDETSRQASYTSGTDTQTLTFEYTVQDADGDGDVSYESGQSIQLNGGTIKDAAGNDAATDFSEQSVDITGVKVDATDPSITTGPSITNGNGQFEISLTADDGGTAYYTVYSNSPSSAPSASEIKDGSEGVTSNSFDVTAGQSVSTTVSTSIENGETYYVYIVVEDDGGNTVVSSELTANPTAA